MIEANELRKGNFVYIIEPDEKPDGTILGSSETMTVASISSAGVCLEDYGCSIVPFDEIHGIKLTPETLKKAGFSFRKHLDDYFIKVGLSNSILIVTEIATLICASNQQPCYFKKVEYLHQLQNLYFALTGEELELKNPE